jgi:hypothetical protein
MIGRALGIGVRVAGRIVGTHVTAHTQPAGTRPQSPSVQSSPFPGPASSVSARPAGQQAGQFVNQAARGVSQGVGGLLRPFRRVGGILWLEVTGVLFLLPAVVFAPTLWRSSLEYAHTTDHKTFWTSALVVIVFLYLGVSSFWRAHRRQNAP